MSNVYAQFAKQFLEKGYSVIPDIGGSKAPAISGWTEFCKRLPSIDEIESWSRNFKNTGISVCLGEASGIVVLDVDVSEPILLEKIINILPESPVAKFGSKGITRFYKYKGERTNQLKINNNTAVELLSDGKKTTLPPSIHEKTGQPYIWIGQSLLDIDKNDLPILPTHTIEQLALLLKGENKDFTVDGNRVTTGRNQALGSFCSDLIRRRVPVDDAIKELIKQDSETSETPLFSDVGEFNHTEVFTNALTFYTRHLASINKKHFHNNEYYEVPVTLSAVTKEMADQAAVGKLQAGENTKSSNSLASSFVLNVPTISTRTLPKAQGIVGKLIQNVLDNAYIPQPEFAYGAALAAMSTLVGRKVIFNNMAPNLYILNIGPSGCGKDMPQQLAKSWLVSCGGETLLGAGDYVSDASLMDSLSTKPVRLDVIDEASGLLGAATKGGNSFDTKMADVLCELYTTSNNKFLGRALADKDGRLNVRGACFRPNVNLLCSTTPTGFSNSLSSKSLEKGLLGRFIMFTGIKKRSHRREDATELPFEVRSAMRWWVEYKPEELTDHIIGQVVQDVTRLKATEEANARLNEIFNELDEKRYNSDDNDPLLPVIARMFQQVLKISMLHACGRETEQIPTVNLTDVEFGYSMVLYIFDNMKILLSRNIHSNKNEMISNKLLSLIESAGVDGIDKTEIVLRTRNLNKKERDDALRDLEEGELVYLNCEILNKKRQMIYRSTKCRN